MLRNVNEKEVDFLVFDSSRKRFFFFFFFRLHGSVKFQVLRYITDLVYHSVNLHQHNGIYWNTRKKFLVFCTKIMICCAYVVI